MVLFVVNSLIHWLNLKIPTFPHVGFHVGSKFIGDDFLTVLGFDVFAACMARVIVRPTIEAEGATGPGITWASRSVRQLQVVMVPA